MTALPASDEPVPSLMDGISTIIRVFMALNGIRTQKEVGQLLGWNESKTTRKFQGKWDLEDLPALARLTGLSVSDLVGNPDEAVSRLRSSCFANLTLVTGVSGEQMELAFVPTPALTSV